MNLEELDVVLGGRSILNPREYNSLALAHIGDAVFEVLVRLTVLTDGNAPVNKKQEPLSMQRRRQKCIIGFRIS